MHWEMSENVQAMKRSLRIAREEGASICAFAELAITGFHRRIGEWARPELLEPAVSEICVAAENLGIATVFGAPTFGPSGARYNSHLFVNPKGEVIGVVGKVGLTAPEATFFAPGANRPTLSLAGLKCSAVICREVEDTEQVAHQLTGTGLQVIFWPGQMRPDPEKPIQDPPEHVAHAQTLARQTAAYVVQTNWPNALNRPEEGEQAGHSVCIAPTGEILFRLPKATAGIAAFNLGENTFRWHPSVA
jgi:omega-amidase